MTPEEMIQVCRRIGDHLKERSLKSRNKLLQAKEAHAKDTVLSRLAKTYLARAQEYYAFNKLIEVCVELGRQVDENNGHDPILLSIPGSKKDMN